MVEVPAYPESILDVLDIAIEFMNVHDQIAIKLAQVQGTTYKPGGEVQADLQALRSWFSTTPSLSAVAYEYIKGARHA